MFFVQISFFFLVYFYFPKLDLLRESRLRFHNPTLTAYLIVEQVSCNWKLLLTSIFLFPVVPAVEAIDMV